MRQADPLALARIGLAVSGALPGREDGGGHVLLLTSIEADVASEVAHRLASEMASRAEGEVVLVGAPDHRGAGKGKACAGGLAALVASGTLNAKALSRGEASALDCLPGTAPAPSDAFFRPEAVSAAVAALRCRFQLSVINGPVLGECGAFLQQVDQVLLVVDASATLPRDAQRAMRRAGVSAEDIDGAILVNARPGLPAWLGGE